MADMARIEVIRSNAQAAIKRADELIARVSDPTFQKMVAGTKRRLGDIESFFLNHAEDVIPMNEELWLQAPSTSCRCHISELQDLDRVAASYDYKIQIIHE